MVLSHPSKAGEGAEPGSAVPRRLRWLLGQRRFVPPQSLRRTERAEELGRLPAARRFCCQLGTVIVCVLSLV